MKNVLSSTASMIGAHAGALASMNLMQPGLSVIKFIDWWLDKSIIGCHRNQSDCCTAWPSLGLATSEP